MQDIYLLEYPEIATAGEVDPHSPGDGPDLDSIQAAIDHHRRNNAG